MTNHNAVSEDGMLRVTSPMMGYALHATDGEFGSVKDLLFDDEAWVVRYLVADTRKWLPGRKVLIPPTMAGPPDWEKRLVPVQMSKQEIEDAPPLAEDRPVSRQYEIALYQHHGWPMYWGSRETMGVWPMFMTEHGASFDEPEGDEHLRSVRETTGYHIAARDGEIGHVEDFIVNDHEWWLNYLVVDTRNWLPGRKVIVSPAWVESFDWSKRQVHVDLTKDSIANAPEFDPNLPINRAYEERLYDFYGRPRYWR